MKDIILRGTLGNADARFFMAATTGLVEKARRIHDMSPTATAALGRLLTASAIMGVMLGEGSRSVTVTVKGGGPAGSLVAVAGRNGGVKGYAANPRADLPVRADGKLDVSGLVGCAGTMTVVRENETAEPYIGQSELVSGEIAEDFAQYFAVREQQPSLVALGVLVGGGKGVLSAGGLLVQPLPGCRPEMIDILEAKAPMIGDLSRRLHAQGGDAEKLLASVFGEAAWQVRERVRPAFTCDCSMERVEKALIALGGQALSEMAHDLKPALVNCHFCAKEYSVTSERIARLQALGRAERNFVE